MHNKSPFLSYLPAIHFLPPPSTLSPFIPSFTLLTFPYPAAAPSILPLILSIT
jgi:hypothetical protein